MRWSLLTVILASSAFLLLTLGSLSPVAIGDDWPMYGRDVTHNTVSPETNPPTRWEIGDFERKTNEWKRESSRNVKWAARLGTSTFGDPVIAGGLVWVGTNNWLSNGQPGQDNPPDASGHAAAGEALNIRPTC